MSSAAASPLPHVATSPRSRHGGAAPLDAAAVERLRKLDALLDLSCPELERLYVGARAPRIGQVAGDLRGRMLAWPSLETRPGVAGAIRGLAGSKGFPWRGKTFSPRNEVNGEGINRVFSDRFRLFRFETGQAWLKTKTREILWLYFALASADGGLG